MRVRFKERTALPGQQIALPGSVHEIPDDHFRETLHERVDDGTPADDPKPWDHPEE